jgi:hypothetical protein
MGWFDIPGSIFMPKAGLALATCLFHSANIARLKIAGKRIQTQNLIVFPSTQNRFNFSSMPTTTLQ